MKIGDTRGELREESLDFAGEERLRHVFEDGFEVMFEEFEDEEDAAQTARSQLCLQIKDWGKGDREKKKKKKKRKAYALFNPGRVLAHHDLL